MKVEVNRNKISFSEHDDIMRLFRQAHANVAMVNGPRPDESSFLQSTHPLSANHLKMETGGLSLPVNALDWTSFFPIPRVASYKLLPN